MWFVCHHCITQSQIWSVDVDTEEFKLLTSIFFSRWQFKWQTNLQTFTCSCFKINLLRYQIFYLNKTITAHHFGVQSWQHHITHRSKEALITLIESFGGSFTMWYKCETVWEHFNLNHKKPFLALFHFFVYSPLHYSALR